MRPPQNPIHNPSKPVPPAEPLPGVLAFVRGTLWGPDEGVYVRSDKSQAPSIGPTWNVYVAFGAIAALAPLSLFLNSWEKKTPEENAYLGILIPGAVLLYLANRTVRLRPHEVTQGFGIFGISIPYENITRVRKETRGKRRGTVLVIYQRDSARRIVVNPRFQDPEKLREFLQLFGQRTPQVREDLFLPV